MKTKNGFTMIELIVVVTIIALLTVVAVVSYSATGKKSRDSKRMADLEKIRVALELYRQEKSVYPSDTDLLSPNYLQEWPKDPKTAVLYPYVIGTSYSYTLYSQMEDLGSTNGDWSGFCDGCNYRLLNP